LFVLFTAGHSSLGITLMIAEMRVCHNKVGYGMDLVSAFGDRCSITLTLLLTIVATELPDHIKEVEQVAYLKGWSFNFVVAIILKDIGEL